MSGQHLLFSVPITFPCFRRNQKGTFVKVFSSSSLGSLSVFPLAASYQVSSLCSLGKRRFELEEKMPQLSLGGTVV